ncbi:type VII secretion target [Bacillus cereus]|uniref:type VII secretion target n=1 Tax=Bacillus cereus TaxID=1396 RepID=UPI00366B6D64
MSENLHIDPDTLRRLALQNQQVADDIRAWAEQPHDWLREFPARYGVIADKVHQALNQYFNARYKAGHGLAGQYDQAAAYLTQAADELERSDQDGAAAINRAGPTSGAAAPIPPATGTGQGPAIPGQATPPGTTIPPGVPVSDSASSVGQQPGGTAPTSATTSPLSHAGAHIPVSPDAPAVPNASGIEAAPVREAGTAVASAAADPATVATSSSGVAVPAADMTTAGAISAPTGESRAPVAVTAADEPSPTLPVLAPFAAAVAAARDRESGTGHVVNAVVNEDLVTARTLLGAVLAAVDEPAIGLAWAVSVMRGPDGARVFITTNEGRGWLPAGLYLPREVSTPWQSDESLDAAGGSAWEGVADPARVLAEFALAAGPRSAAKLTALVSSSAIDTSLRGAMPDVAMEGLVRPAYDVDLRASTPDTADRLALSGPAAAEESIAAVPDSAIVRRRVELAGRAHEQVGGSVATPPEAVGARTLRERILTAVRAGHPVSAQLWQDLHDADDLLTATMFSRRVDSGRIGLGLLRVEDQASLLRAMVFERRCTELVLLLAEPPTRQSLRDSVYAYEQIAAHPSFAATPLAQPAPALDAAGAERRVTTSAISVGPAGRAGALPALAEHRPSVGKAD